MNASIANDNKPSLLDLDFDTLNEGMTLTCQFVASAATAASIDLIGIRNAINAQGFCNAQLDDPSMRALLQAIRNKENWQGKLAEKFDAEVYVEINADELSAQLSITCEQGGEPISKSMISRAMSKSGIIGGVLKKNIFQLYEKAQQQKPGKTVHAIVARGSEPIAGADAWFETLLEQKTEVKPVENEDGSVDYRNFSSICSVVAGSPLLRRHPASAGQAGETVTGKIVPAKNGETHDFEMGEGVVKHPIDTNVLVAAIPGIPIIFEKGARIDQKLQVEKVDISTGNIDFDGDLTVTKDVHAGMMIKISGDLVVKGTVEAARIEVGGNVHISGGMIGGGGGNKGQTEGSQAVVICGGDFRARFVEHVFLKVGNDAYVQEGVAHSHIIAKNRVLVGQPSGRGQVVGGLIQTGSLLDVKTLGSQAYIVTTIEVGFDEEQKKRFNEIEEKITEHETRLEELDKALAFYLGNKKPNQEQFILRIKQTTAQTRENCQKLQHDKTQLLENQQRNLESQIVCRKKAFPGVNVNIASLILELKEERNAGIYYVEKDKVSFNAGQR